MQYLHSSIRPLQFVLRIFDALCTYHIASLSHGCIISHTPKVIRSGCGVAYVPQHVVYRNLDVIALDTVALASHLDRIGHTSTETSHASPEVVDLSSRHSHFLDMTGLQEPVPP